MAFAEEPRRIAVMIGDLRTITCIFCLAMDRSKCEILRREAEDLAAMIRAFSIRNSSDYHRKLLASDPCFTKTTRDNGLQVGVL
jgi:hypothetical protein